MSNKQSKNYQDLEAEIILERIENKPVANSVCKATVIAINSNGIYVDINKSYEGFVAANEISKNQYSLGQQIDVFVVGEDRQQEGVYKLSVKEIQSEQQWQQLETLQGQNLEATIQKVLKSGLEALIEVTGQIGFIPYGYIDNRLEQLKDKEKEQWTNIKIPVRLHEFDKSKNKIILNSKVISDEVKEHKVQELFNGISLGQELEVTIIRIADFGVFVDLGGLDALIPSSELSWRRFKKPSDVISIGQKVKAKVFKIDQEQRRIALSAKQSIADPWSTLPTELRIGFKQKSKVVSQAEFGVFVELLPGIEALLHRSNFEGQEQPEIGKEIYVEVINIEVPKKRLGVKFSTPVIDEATNSETENNDTKELEHV
ncbi:MAG: S1 RNA-binding domain-containing protein [Candidatus Caenarcaniphilales bacterium]|jgi:ribosomal protein S1|nr:S1 RNA-binding domain-containing protein [Candidatus Caenarcaniphilales bacterium]